MSNGNNESRYYIAVDLGAESGRVMLGKVGKSAGQVGKVSLEQMHRFANGPLEMDGALHWDFDKLMTEIKAGISKAFAACPGKVSSIGVDTWGVDFGLLGPDGKLLENPYQYRDSLTEAVPDEVFKIVPQRELYEMTGISSWRFNTIYQLWALKQKRPELLANAKRLVLMADLVSYHLCGRAYAEYTLASTTGLMDMRTGKWCKSIFDKLGLPFEIMPEIVQAGTIAARLLPEVAQELSSTKVTAEIISQIPVVAVGSHDTACAIAAVPHLGSDDKWAYLSSGTWSLMGVETDKPVINDDTFGVEFTNEGSAAGGITLLKNIMGLWLLQECKRQWQREGSEYSYSELVQMAREAEAFAGKINPNEPEFMQPGNMPQRINDYLEKTGQARAENRGQLVRIILESLADYYRQVTEDVSRVTGKNIDVLHIVGGGIKNELLCELTAEATGKKVITGPAEGTAVGSVLIQAMTMGQVASAQEIRQIVAKSFELKQYT